jgi:phospholipase/lecithinase/hemolysin
MDSTPQDVVQRAVLNLLGLVTSLETLGAHNILVPGMPDLGLTPYFRSLGADAAAQGSAITDAVNTALSASLPADVDFYDTAALLRSMVANPGAYGFTNVTDPCFNGISVCANPAQYLYFDDFHPTMATASYAARGFLTATVVPEPPALVLVLVGLALCGFARKRVV